MRREPKKRTGKDEGNEENRQIEQNGILESGGKNTSIIIKWNLLKRKDLIFPYIPNLLLMAVKKKNLLLICSKPPICFSAQSYLHSKALLVFESHMCNMPFRIVDNEIARWHHFCLLQWEPLVTSRASSRQRTREICTNQGQVSSVPHNLENKIVLQLSPSCFLSSGGKAEERFPSLWWGGWYELHLLSPRKK